MNALLIISHGSRRQASNEEVLALAAQIHAESDNPFHLTGCAFLELTKPHPSEAIETLIQQGATTIHIFPHFLAAGTHVTADLPAIVKAAQAKHPQTSFRILPHLGGLEGLSSLITRAFSSKKCAK
jgi:sirohydrochlorin ferrochelatase